jgi:hypothetical protein
VKGYHATDEYQKSMRKRGVWVESLFGEAKNFHQLNRFQLRRLKNVNIEGLMVAAGQNINRLLKYSPNGLVFVINRRISDTKNHLLWHIHGSWIRLRSASNRTFSTG